MKLTTQTMIASFIGAAVLVCGQLSAADERESIARLRQENASLAENLVAVKKQEQEASRKLSEIQLRLEAMGEGLLDGGENRLVKAVSDLEVMSRKLKEIEGAAIALSESTQRYLSTAIAADPEARVEVETKLRDLDAAIGLREAPQRSRKNGSLQGAQVVSVDTESGSSILVVNVGEKKSAVVGMPFEVFRNDNKVAEALVALTRDDVSALLVMNLENDANPVRRGDRVLLKSN